MCFRKRFIHTICGHSRWGFFIAACPSKDADSPCPLQLHHPYHTHVFESLCLRCRLERDQCLKAVGLGIRVPGQELNDRETDVPKSRAIVDIRLEMKESKMNEEMVVVNAVGKEEEEAEVTNLEPDLPSAKRSPTLAFLADPTVGLGWS